MEAAIRFSQNSLPGQDNQHFLKIDIAGRSLQLYNIQRFGKRSIKYELTHSSKKLAPFRAFDWHPTEATLVAVGQTGGEAGLVNLAYPDQKPASFTARNPRSCNAVALNTSGWVAIGLDKARTDPGLYIWDINHHANNSGTKSYRNRSDPLHKIASGEQVTSLRFFHDQPQLLVAGVQGFVRLYDCRDSTPSSVLQFATKCINNIAVDNRDENYFASCLQTNTPTVAVWDRRMVTRTDAAAHFGFATPVSQAEQQPEVSAELGNFAQAESHIFGLRFSKTHRGHLGVLSSTGQLKIVSFHKNEIQQGERRDQQPSSEWNEGEPEDIFVKNIQNILDKAISPTSDNDSHKLLSFDFTTATSSKGQPTIITLDKHGDIEFRPVTVSDSHALLSSAIVLGKYDSLNNALKSSEIGKAGDKNNIINQSQIKSSQPGEVSKVFESLKLPQQRCLDGYLLDAAVNCQIVEDDETVLALWKWLKHTQIISANNALVEGDTDLSYAGVCDIWMEEIDVQARSVRSSFNTERPHISSTIRDTARRLGLVRGKGCSTDYLQHRALCLHVLGLPWLRGDVQRECDRLVSNKELTRAAAIALFAGEEKIAQKALRAAGSGNGHKMLAMALVSSRNRVHKARRPSLGSSRSREEESDSSNDSQDDEWQDIISAISADLTDCYAKSILAFVKTNKWEDVISQTCLPLIYRVMVALRHCDDMSLTLLIPKLKSQAVSSGDLEGIFLTGLGTPSSIDLLMQYAKITGDVQTVALAMSFDAAYDRFLPPDSPHTRTVQCFREIYKSQLMSYSLKFDKARFNVALSRAIRSHNLPSQPRRKEQIRLVCSHCSQSISQFGHDQQTEDRTPSTPSTSITETKHHPLAPNKAAIMGTVCPKCGRHLPRCGVCNMWLGTPDDTFSKWYNKHPRPIPSTTLSSHRNSNSNSNTADHSNNSTITAVGPGTGTPIIAISSAHGPANSKAMSKKLTAADLTPNVVEVVDAEEVARQKREKRWYESMRRFTVFCTRCSHGFHAEHARMWFDGDEEGGREGHKFCPVPSCECVCNA